jgi:hypothetical protein
VGEQTFFSVIFYTKESEMTNLNLNVNDVPPTVLTFTVSDDLTLQCENTAQNVNVVQEGGRLELRCETPFASGSEIGPGTHDSPTILVTIDEVSEDGPPSFKVKCPLTWTGKEVTICVDDTVPEPWRLIWTTSWRY